MTTAVPGPTLNKIATHEQDEQLRAAILAGLEEAESDLQEGRYSDWTDETLPHLAAELKREARATRDPEEP